MADDQPITSPDQTDPTAQNAGVTSPDQVDPSLPTPIFGQFARQDSSAPPSQQPAQALPAKVGLEVRGMTDAGLKRSRGLFGQADANVAAFAQQDQATTAAEQAKNQQGYGRLEGAVGQEVDATKEFADRDQALQQKIADFNNHAADLEQRLNGEAKVERQRYLAGYQEQLAGVRQLAMESGNPLNALSTGGKVGLMGAQFAQGFLAARGIKIDVAGQVDRWVDRSIQEHQQKIANMRASADDQLHLYEIARQSSQDDWEARQRYRGFVIQGLQTSVQMNAARFQSNIAIAHANEQVAKLQIEGDATERAIGDAHFNRVHQMMTTEYDKAFKTGQLAIEQQKLQIEKDKNAAAAKAAKLPAYVTDTTQFKTDENGKRTSGGKVVAVYNPDAPGVTKAAENISSASTYHGNIVKGVQRLRELRTDNNKGEFFNSVGSAGYRRFDAARNELIADLLLANSGKAVTDAEFQRYKNMLADDKAWQSGKNTSLLSELQVSSNRKLNAVVHGEEAAGNIRVLRGDEALDPRFGASQDRYMPYEGDLDPSTTATDDADLHGAPPVRTWAEKAVNAAKADPTDTRGAEKPVEEKPSKAYETLMTTEPGQSQPHNTLPVEMLVRTYLEPSHTRAAFGPTVPDDDNAVKKQVLDSLHNLTGAKDPFVSGYAEIMLNKLQTDPDGLRELLLPPPLTAEYGDPSQDPNRTKSGHTPKK